MTVALSINGTTYNYPENQDENWGTVATQWATAVTNGMLQKAGGNFTLLADVNFGATYGLVSTYFKSRSSNISTTGVIRLANNEGVGFRNAANGADKILKLDGSDKWSFGATALSEAELGLLASVSGVLVTEAGTQTLTNKTLTTPVIASFISNGVTFTNPTADGSNGQVLKTNGSGALSFTTVVTNPMTTKGDLISTSTGSDVTRTAVGSNGALLFANSSATSGIDWTSTSGLVWDSSNSRLGIGKSNPTYPLHVLGTSATLVSTLDRSTTVTNTSVNAARIKATSSNDMVDQFGPVIQFSIEDTAAVANDIASVSAIRSGSDTTGSLVFATKNAGSDSTKLIISHAGEFTFPTGIHNNGGTTGGTQAIASGTYSPTVSNQTNISSQTTYDLHWIRVGKVVTVAGRMDITPTATTGAAYLRMTLPFNNGNFTAAGQAGGGGGVDNFTNNGYVVVLAVSGDTKVFVEIAKPLTTSSHVCHFCFSYVLV